MDAWMDARMDGQLLWDCAADGFQFGEVQCNELKMDLPLDAAR